jgi:hypothetical protein
VDLVNVAFAPSGSSTYQTPDRLSGIEAYEELKEVCEREWRLVLVDVPFEVGTYLFINLIWVMLMVGMPRSSSESIRFDVSVLHW